MDISSLFGLRFYIPEEDTSEFQKELVMYCTKIKKFKIENLNVLLNCNKIITKKDVNKYWESDNTVLKNEEMESDDIPGDFIYEDYMNYILSLFKSDIICQYAVCCRGDSGMSIDIG